MLLLTGVIELKWLARKCSSNCHLEKVLSVFKFPYSLSGWESQFTASGMSIRNHASARLDHRALPHLKNASVGGRERDARMNNFLHRALCVNEVQRFAVLVQINRDANIEVTQAT